MSNTDGNLSLAEAFVCCPRCGCKIAKIGENPLRCDECDYVHFFSPTVAVAAIIADEQGRVLFLRRQRDPGRGLLGLPGGFVDAGERAEDAVRREAMEEVNVAIERIEFVASYPNEYVYRGVVLPVCDMFFACEIESFEAIEAEKSEVAEWMLRVPDEQTLSEMAFTSNRKAVEDYLTRR